MAEGSTYEKIMQETMAFFTGFISEMAEALEGYSVEDMPLVTIGLITIACSIIPSLDETEKQVVRTAVTKADNITRSLREIMW